MKFRDAVHAYFKAQGLSDEALLIKMKALDHGKQTRFFDKLDLDADTETAEKVLLGPTQDGEKPKSAYQMIAAGKKSKTFSHFQTIEHQLTDNKEWDSFWENKNEPEDLELKQNLINAYRFAIIQNLYLADMSKAAQDKKAIEKIKKYVKPVEELSNQYQEQKEKSSKTLELSTPDAVIQALDNYIAKKSKPGTLQIAKTLARRDSIMPKKAGVDSSFSETEPAPILTARYLSHHDQEKIKIAQELKALLENPLDNSQSMLSAIRSLDERYKKIRGSSTSTIQECLDKATERYVTPTAQPK